MIKIIVILKRVFGWMGALAVIIASPQSHAQDPVTVQVLAVHYAGNIQYSYRVINHTRARSIVSVSIGNRGVQPADPVYPTNARPELSIYPAGSYWERQPDQGDSQNETLRIGGTYTSPPGWSAHILEYEESGSFSVDWVQNVQTDRGILPSQTFNFGVTVPTLDEEQSAYIVDDPAYLNGHFTVGFAYSDATDEGPAFWHYTGPIVSLDTTPPSLTVSLSPNILRPNEKLVPITATITVMDDHDPMPEITLESITANEPLDEEEDVDADIGADERSFKLRAERKDKNKAGRIYTVTYSATDASGNKSTASATVSVPHDHDEKEKAEGKNSSK